MNNRMLWGPVLLLLFFVGGVSGVNDPNAPDTVMVESIQCEAGEKVIVPINFFNDEILGAITIPLTWNSSDITLDSINFSWWSRVRYISYRPDTINNENRTIIAGVIVMFEDYIPPGTGLFGELYFDIPPGTPDQIIKIDTITIPPAAYLLFADELGSTFLPQFVAGQIMVGDPPLPPHIDLSLDSMVFEGITGYPNPAAQILNIYNTGEQDLDWTALWSSSWLSVTPSSGTAWSVSSIRPDISGLPDGIYYDTVVISCPEADNDPQILPIRLTVTTFPPDINYSPSNFIVSTILGEGSPDDHYLNIWTSVPGSELNWTVSNSSDWLTLSSSTGSPPDSVALQFDVEGLPFGIHYDTIVISDPEATNSPQEVPVTLQIVSDLPVLDVPGIVLVVVEAGTTVDPEAILIANAGEGLMTFAVSDNSSRIIGITPLSGTAPQEIVVSFKTFPLAPGEYYDTILVTSPEAVNSPQYIITHLHVTDSPAQLFVGPTEIDLNYYECWQGIDPDSVWHSLQILNLGDESMFWNLTHSSLWLDVSKTSGEDDGFVTLTPRDNLVSPPGDFVDTIIVSAAYSKNSPCTAFVTLHVVEGIEDPEIVANELVINLPAQEVFGPTWDTLISLAEVLNQHAGCMDYWVDEDIPWLIFIDSTGSAPAQPRIMVDIGDYTYGEYPASYWINSASATNGPVRLDVNLQVWRLRGDNNWSNNINVGDIVHLIFHIFRGGPGPQPEWIVGDVNCDGSVNVADAVYLVMYIFEHGDPPCGNPGSLE